jgi:hypothetical protein
VHNQDVCLKPLKRLEARRLLQHGYSVADATLRTFIKPGTPPPGFLPDIKDGRLFRYAK